MKELRKVKLWLDSEGNFQEHEISGAPYIIANKEVDVEPRPVAYFDFSGSTQTSDNKLRKAYIDKARELGIKEYVIYDSEPRTEISPLDELEKTHDMNAFYGGATTFEWLEDLPNSIIPYIFTDGDFHHQISQVIPKSNALWYFKDSF